MHDPIERHWVFFRSDRGTLLIFVLQSTHDELQSFDVEKKSMRIGSRLHSGMSLTDYTFRRQFFLVQRVLIALEFDHLGCEGKVIAKKHRAIDVPEDSHLSSISITDIGAHPIARVEEVQGFIQESSE